MRELYVRQTSLVHAADARVKVILTLAFIVLLNLSASGAWPTYVLFLSLALSAALLSRLDWKIVLGRALLSLPFVLAAFPLILTGPAPFARVGFFDLWGFDYSQPGLERFVSIAIKSWLSVQAAVLLTATTRAPDLFSALEQLKIPKAFVSILRLTWRYIFVIGDEVTRMLRARASRSAGSAAGKAGGSLWWRARVTGSMAGVLFVRSIERSERVYAAMLSRGYNGDSWSGPMEPLSLRDRWLAALGLAFFVSLWLLGFALAGWR